VRGFFQPVEIKAPEGVLVSLAADGQFDEPQQAPICVAMLLGQVYRIRVMGMPMAPGREVFPTIEVVDRLYTPVGQEVRFPIPIELTEEDLRLALQGKFVTRVIYLEDPQLALPVASSPEHQNWFETPPGRDPLAMADELGRPVAILRLGARLPDGIGGPDARFLFGCPVWLPCPQCPAPTIPEAPPTPSGEEST
jgi:hypothetical protein